MNGEERRKSIITKLQNSTSPVSATALASLYSVTRQIIVADIALLRASGFKISAKSRGYVLDGNTDGILKKIAVMHGADKLLSELYTVIDNGGRFIDVIVEHPVYGKISAELGLSSRYDVDEFVAKVEKTGAHPLSDLTENIHVHTIAVKNDDMYQRILSRLKELNILIEAD